MQGLLKSFSYVFHPLFVPFAGALAYVSVSPISQQREFLHTGLLPIFILTIVIPIIFFLILKSLKLISSIFAPSFEERKYPLLLGLILHLAIIYKVVPIYHIPELYFYFLGIMLALLSTLILLYVRFKASIHLMGMGALLLFLVGMSIHFEINITIALSVFTFFTGLVATSRLYMRAHTKSELFIGFLIGSLSQLLLFQFWL